MDHHHLSPQQLGELAASVQEPAVIAPVAKLIYTNLSRLLRGAALSMIPVPAESFIAAPKLQADNSSIALINHHLPLPGAFTVLADYVEGQEPTYKIFAMHEDQLSESTFVMLEKPEHIEMVRQLSTVRHVGSRLFTVLRFDQPIQGYEYFMTELERAERDARITAERLAAMKTPAPAPAEVPEVVESTKLDGNSSEDQ